MSKAKKILAILTAAVSCMSLASCGEDTNWIAEFNGEKINAGIYLYYELSEYNTVLTYLQSSNPTTEEVSKDDVYYIEDTKETVNAYDYIQSEAMESLKKFCVVESEYERLNLDLTESEIAEIEEMVDYYYNTMGYGENYTENGISYESLITLYQNNYKYSNLFFALYGTYEKIGDDGEVTEIEGEFYVDDESVWEYFEEHNVRVKVMTFPLYGDDSAALTEEEKIDVEELANEYLSRAEDGEDFDELIDEYNKSLEEDDETSEEETDDSEEEEEVDEYANETIVSDESTAYSEDVLNRIFELELKDGSAITKIVDKDVNNEIYVIAKYDLREREDLFEERRDSLLADLVGEDYDEYLQNIIDNGLALTLNDKAVDRYVPKKLKFDY